jgi:hypothetical protein
VTYEYVAVDEVPQAQACGAIAEIYADICDCQGSSLVNLIWRHLATRPAALDWAWAVARPAYAGGSAARAANTLRARLDLPALPVVTSDVSAAAGLAEEQMSVIRTILHAYNHGNSLNLVAFSALLHPPPDAANTRAHTSPEHDGHTPAKLPPIPALDEIPLALQTLVLRLNQFGVNPQHKPIVATLYRHLAPWPPYLALAWSALAPLAEDERLDAAITQTQETALSLANSVALGPGGQCASDDATFARGAISEFVASAIARMVPIGLMLTQALASSSAEPNHE